MASNMYRSALHRGGERSTFWRSRPDQRDIQRDVAALVNRLVGLGIEPPHSDRARSQIGTNFPPVELNDAPE
jgi:hypothetical protein